MIAVNLVRFPNLLENPIEEPDSIQPYQTNQTFSPVLDAVIDEIIVIQPRIGFSVGSFVHWFLPIWILHGGFWAFRMSELKSGR